MKGEIDLIYTKMIEYFGCDVRRIEHTKKVYDFATKIFTNEGGNEFIIKTSSILHDIGIHEAERKYNSSAGHYQELEGPIVARDILAEFAVSDEDLNHICDIIANHHSAKNIDTLEFKIIWDSDWLVNIPNELNLKNKKNLKILIKNTFKTKTGKKIADKLFL